MAVASHDLRNPLSAIKIAGQMIEKLVSTEEKMKPVMSLTARITKSAERMDKMIGDFLEMSKIDAGAVTYERAPLATQSVVDQALEQLLPLAAEKSIRVSTDLRDGAEKVWADKDAVIRVFSNLFGNAIKYAPEGGEIAIRGRSKGDSFEFSVTDTGPGIPQADLPHIFDRFWQAKHAYQKGVGLGLAIAKSLIEGQGGKIWVASELKVGTAFFFSLPRQIAGTRDPSAA